jgi:hypothetical protein
MLRPFGRNIGVAQIHCGLSAPADIDGLSLAELKDLVLKLSGEVLAFRTLLLERDTIAARCATRSHGSKAAREGRIS